MTVQPVQGLPDNLVPVGRDMSSFETRVALVRIGRTQQSKERTLGRLERQDEGRSRGEIVLSRRVPGTLSESINADVRNRVEMYEIACG